jgi:crossover junction endodeoxyribonuclease RusA
MKITIDLPAPPSVNRLWRTTSSVGVRRSAEYLTWIKQAGLLLLTQKPKLSPRAISGPYSLIVRLKPRNADLDNFIKAVSDLLQTHGLIENDRLCRKILMIWDENLDVDCRVTIRGIRRVT